jgi:ubiquinone/menaquinone biosynthesis C-methylase UbiE
MNAEPNRGSLQGPNSDAARLSSKVQVANRSAHNAFASIHDRVASHIAKPRCRDYYRRLLDEFLRQEGVSLRGKTIAELGCGTGNWTDFFLNRSVQLYSGVDISEGMIDVATRKHADERAVFSSRPVEQFLEGASSAAFDLIFSFSFAHHITDLPKFFFHLERVLQPGGLYIALHEPVIRELPQEKRSLGEVVDSVCAVLAGWDMPETPLKERFASVGRMVAQKFVPKKSKGSYKDPTLAADLVDYQLSLGGFTPANVQAIAAGSGLQARSICYSYYRFPLFSPIFGSIKNEFALIARKLNRAIGES